MNCAGSLSFANQFGVMTGFYAVKKIFSGFFSQHLGNPVANRMNGMSPVQFVFGETDGITGFPVCKTFRSAGTAMSEHAVPWSFRTAQCIAQTEFIPFIFYRIVCGPPQDQGMFERWFVNQTNSVDTVFDQGCINPGKGMCVCGSVRGRIFSRKNTFPVELEPHIGKLCRICGNQFCQIGKPFFRQSVKERADIQRIQNLFLKKMTQFLSGGLLSGATAHGFMAVLGKPASAAQAAATLSRLSGKTHYVITGVCVRRGEKKIVRYERTEVRFNILSPEFIAAYVAGGSPLDKAGSYGIQDEGVVKEYFGSYTNVVGLPVNTVKDMLEDISK